MNFKSPQKQRGIALLAVLAVSVALSLLITSATVMMQRQVNIGETAKQQFFEKAAAYKKQQELIYLLATQRITRAGVSSGKNQAGNTRINGEFLNFFTQDEVRLDSYKYTEEIEGIPVTYNIQAADGLIPINVPNQEWLKLWLQSYGLDIFQTSKLADRLADYADEDDWARPAGAEALAYTQKGMAPPPNFLVQHCNELYNILSWAKAANRFNMNVNQCNIERTASLNVNAAPPKLLANLLNIDAGNLVIARQNGDWFINTDAITLIDPSLNDEVISVVSNSTFQVRIKTENTNSLILIKRGNHTLLPFEIRAQ